MLSYESGYKLLGNQTVSPFMVPVPKAAYNGSEDWIDEINDYIDGNFEYMDGFIKEKMEKVTFYPSEGTYLAWLDFNKYGFSSDELFEIIVNQANIYLKNGLEFGDEYVHEIYDILHEIPKAVDGYLYHKDRAGVGIELENTISRIKS